MLREAGIFGEEGEDGEADQGGAQADREQCGVAVRRPHQQPEDDQRPQHRAAVSSARCTANAVASSRGRALNEIMASRASLRMPLPILSIPVTISDQTSVDRARQTEEDDVRTHYLALRNALAKRLDQTTNAFDQVHARRS